MVQVVSIILRFLSISLLRKYGLIPWAVIITVPSVIISISFSRSFVNTMIPLFSKFLISAIDD